MKIAVDLDDTESVESALDELLDGTRDAKAIRRRERFAVRFGSKVKGKFRAFTGPAIACDLASGYDENTRKPSSGAIFFARATRTAKLRKKVTKYVEQIIAHNVAGGPIWETDEAQLGEDAAEALALADAKSIATFIAFLRSNDLDHEVHQSDAIIRIVTKHGWIAETIALLAARASDCSGQGGDYDLQYLIAKQPIPKKLQKAFVGAVIEGCRSVAVDAYPKYVRPKLVRALGEGFPEPEIDDDFTAGVNALDDPKTALVCFTRFVEKESRPRRVRAALVEWARTADLERSERFAFNALVDADDAPRSAEALCDQAYELYAADEYDNAIAIYDRAIAADPKHWPAYTWKAECMRQLEHYDGAIKTLQYALAESGDADLYFELGCVYRDAGDLPKALAAFKRNHESGDRRGESGMADVHNLIGCKQLEAGDLDAAATSFTASVDCKVTAHALANIARVRFMQKRYDPALAAAKKSLHLNPTADVHNIIACVEIAHSQYDAAKQSLARALELDPKLHSCRANLVCLHALSGDANAALDALADALANGYDDFNWIATDSDLDSIRPLPRFAELVAQYRR